MSDLDLVQLDNEITLESLCSIIQPHRSEILYVQEQFLYLCENVEELAEGLNLKELKIAEQCLNPGPTWILFDGRNEIWLFREEVVNQLMKYSNL